MTPIANRYMGSMCAEVEDDHLARDRHQCGRDRLIPLQSILASLAAGLAVTP